MVFSSYWIAVFYAFINAYHKHFMCLFCFHDGFFFVVVDLPSPTKSAHMFLIQCILKCISTCVHSKCVSLKPCTDSSSIKFWAMVRMAQSYSLFGVFSTPHIPTSSSNTLHIHSNSIYELLIKCIIFMRTHTRTKCHCGNEYICSWSIFKHIDQKLRDTRLKFY